MGEGYMKRDIRHKYIECDYERVHSKKIDENFDDLHLLDIRTKCSYVTKTIDSGVIRELEVYPIYPKKEMPDEWKIQKGRTAQKNLNNKNAKKNLIRLINSNFKNGDYFITLGYSKDNLPKDHAQAKKNMQNYIRRINYLIKKENLKPAKYIYITEHSEDKKIRCHHHLIISTELPIDIVEGMWKLGRRNNMRKIDTDELWLTGLATYFTKDPKGKKRWCSSNNLKKPYIRKSHSKISKKRVNTMTTHQNLIQHEMERLNPGYALVDYEIYLNPYNGRPYIYTRMRKL